jgi:hypothetical protein
MNAQMPNFADHFEIRELLNISKAQLDALDRSRIRDGKIIGGDNAQKLKVATVFAGIAIEASLNDFLQVHCLFAESPYLQSFFGELTHRCLRGSVQGKIDLLLRFWPQPFDPDLVKDVRRIFQIRNRVVHRTGKLLFSDDGHGVKSLSNDPLSDDDMQHMLSHHNIAERFLSNFWLPGQRELRPGVPDRGLRSADSSAE